MATLELALKCGVVVMLLAGAVSDLRTRRIPNLLTLGGAALGLLLNGIYHLGNGLVSSAEGWALGLLLLLIPFFLNALGAGDVKFLALAGAWLGPAFAYHTLIYGAIIGGAVSLGFLIVTGQLGLVFQPILSGIRANIAVLLVGYWPGVAGAILPGASAAADPPPRNHLYIPFGPALAAGGLLALLLG